MQQTKTKKKRRKRRSGIGRGKTSGSSKSRRRNASVETFSGNATSTGAHNDRAPHENAEDASPNHAEEGELVGADSNAEPTVAAGDLQSLPAPTDKLKIKSLQNQLNYQKRKADALAATNQELKQNAINTQQYASEREKDHEALAKRQQKMVDDANKRADKAREYFTFRYISILSSAISHTLLFSS